MHLDLGLGVTGLALASDGAASQYTAVRLVTLLLVVLGGKLGAILNEERQALVGVLSESLGGQLVELVFRVRLLLFDIEESLSARLENDLSSQLLVIHYMLVYAAVITLSSTSVMFIT